MHIIPIRRLNFGTLGIATLWATVFLAPARAATLNVPTQYPTIQAGIDATRKPGDTVLVADGVYTGPGNVDIDFHGKSITVKSVHGAAFTIIDCQGSQSSQHRGFYLHNGETSASSIDGFTVKNGYQNGSHNGGTSGGNGVGIYASGATVANCTVTGNQGYSFGGGIYSDGGTITNCTVTNNGSSEGGGIYDDRGNVTGCTVSGNVALSFAGIEAPGSIITDCICWGDQSTGEIEIGPAPTIGADPSVYDGSPLVAFCDVHVSPGFEGYYGVGNIDADPQFVNPGVGDFHPGIGSPCLGAGIATVSSAKDQDGLTRPAAPSIGAYEYTHAWSSVGASTGADGFERVLWRRSDGLTTVWKLSPAGHLISQRQFGPYPGWTARAIATGRDNQTRLLWTRADHAASFYLLDADGSFVSQQQYGPYESQTVNGDVVWTAQGLTLSPDNTVRALWTNNIGGATIWAMDTANAFVSRQQYQPDGDWTARSLTVNPNGTERLLWVNSDGTAAFWRLDSQSQFLGQQQYGPYIGYTAQAIAAVPDGTARVAWTATDGHLALWTIDAGNVYAGQTQYGPYAGWSFQGMDVGGDSNVHLLWDDVSGQSALWSLTNYGAFASNTQFGPY